MQELYKIIEESELCKYGKDHVVTTDYDTVRSRRKHDLHMAIKSLAKSIIEKEYVKQDDIIAELRNKEKIIREDIEKILLDCLEPGTSKADEEYIKERFQECLQVADERFFCIAIGHVRPLTVKVLKEVVPEAERQGYKFIFLEDLYQLESRE